jgi:ferrous iron transport protein B
LKGFVLRAGRAIVIVVIALNVFNSIGTDGSVGNENTENSVLSAIGKSITPVFAPMGIDKDNWPATVGIFTGIFAKEVVVGTLDALYAPAARLDDPDLTDMLAAAAASIPANLSEIGRQLADPLGLDLGDLTDTATQAQAQDVQLNTISAMQGLFHGQLGAFAYLLFVLLYMPCVATIGVIFKEIGTFWATFSVAWSFVVAYSCAVVVYQAGTFMEHPQTSTLWLAATVAVAAGFFSALIAWGKRSPGAQLIPIKLID